MLSQLKVAATATATIDGVTAVDLIAAPSISTQRYYIHSIQIFNQTTGENPIIKVYDADTIHFIAKMSDIGDTGGLGGALPGWIKVDFPVPSPVKVGAKLSADATTATGDCFAIVVYSLGDQGAAVL